MLLTVEKSIRWGIYHSIDITMQKLTTNTLKIMIKLTNRHIFNIGMKVIYIVGQCRKSLQ